MAVSVAALSTAEKYLVALIQDRSGIDLAEFLWEDPLASNPEKIFRCWDFQYAWWRDTFAQGEPVDDPTLVIDSCARAVGKTQSIIVRSWAFPIQSPGGEMVVTAPELVHLDPLTSRIEDRIKDIRLTRELLPSRVGMGFKHRPFQVNFTNGAKILGRIPQRDGKGVKGCVVEGTPILTASGYVPVEELAPGDLVATHTGGWKPVVDILVDTNDCLRVAGSQSTPLEISCDHAFLGARNEAGPKHKRDLSETSWFDADDLDGVYWASPNRFDPLPVIPVEHQGSAHRFEMTAGFWWLVGRWLADGFVSRDRKTGKSRKVSWCVHPADAESIEMRLESLGFSPRTIVRSHSSADVVEVASAGWERWLVQLFGSGAANKTLPGFVLGMDERYRQALLSGYLSGDGHWNPKKERWEFGSASKALALGMQMLGQSLGFGAIVTSVEPKSQFTDNPLRSWRVYLTLHGHHVRRNDFLLAKVKSVEPIGKRRVYNPIVADDHSYVAGSIVSHNLHPLRLEMDEAQDYPQQGWIELIETLRHGMKDAQWRAHGVSRGVRDEFYRHSQPGSGWTVHRITGMHRPTWSDAERDDKIEAYGSRDSADYKRNILGLHGDATNPLFVLHRLMACVDDEQGSDYNQDVYYYRRISDEMLAGQPMEMLLVVPGSHKKWTSTWAGMDVGMTNHPSEILVFGEESNKGTVALRLLSRIHLERIRSADQRRVIEILFDAYDLQLITMDRTGLGLPMYQELQDAAPDLMSRVVGYTADERLVVGWKEHEDWEDPEDYEIKRQAKEYGYDTLRVYVDEKRLILPWDRELLGEWQGQTWTVQRAETDAYGKKTFARGKFHTLDAAAMMAVGKEQLALTSFTKVASHDEPVPLVFV